MSEEFDQDVSPERNRQQNITEDLTAQELTAITGADARQGAQYGALGGGLGGAVILGGSSAIGAMKGIKKRRVAAVASVTGTVLGGGVGAGIGAGSGAALGALKKKN